MSGLRKSARTSAPCHASCDGHAVTIASSHLGTPLPELTHAAIALAGGLPLRRKALLRQGVAAIAATPTARAITATDQLKGSMAGLAVQSHQLRGYQTRKSAEARGMTQLSCCPSNLTDSRARPSQIRTDRTNTTPDSGPTASASPPNEKAQTVSVSAVQYTTRNRCIVDAPISSCADIAPSRAAARKTADRSGSSCRYGTPVVSPPLPMEGSAIWAPPKNADRKATTAVPARTAPPRWTFA